MKICHKLVCVCALAVLACACPSAFAQADRGSIEGAVVDQSGAAVPGASLKAQNVATGLAYTATSDSNGLFTFPVVAVGAYQVEAAKEGFATLVRPGVAVTVGARVSLTLTMQVAAAQTRITVNAAAPVVETTRSSVAATVGSEQVANLPVNGRDFMDFILLTPGVTYDNRQGDISFAGQRGTLNSLLVDGSDNNNSFFGQALGRTGSGRAPLYLSFG